MGFTDVAWESRSTEQLARDLTEGPGPRSVGQAGAAWVRVANELASVSDEYGKIVEKIKASFASQGADAAVGKIEEFGRWLQAVSLSAAGNGERAEEAAVANSVAVTAMPNVSEAVEERTARDVMDSLAAYNGAILNGRFAELDEAATGKQAEAAAIMYQYEESCSAIAAPWDQPPPPDVCNGAALESERHAKDVGDGAGTGGGGAGGRTGGSAVAPMPAPLTPFRAKDVKSSGGSKALQPIGSGAGTSAGSGAGGMGGGYGPMAALGRGGDGNREHESSLPTATLDGSGEASASLSDTGASWLPATEQSDAPFTVSGVSWGPSTSVFDELAVPDQPEAPAYADEPERTLEQVSSRWVAPPVIGVDKGLTL
jgi:hypothetical protein